MGEKYEQLVNRLADVQNLQHTAAILEWDQQTQMPPGGAEARAAQLATVTRLGHELFVADETAQLLDAAAAETEGADYDSNEASLVRVVRQDYDEQVKLPSALVAKIAQVTALSHEKWAKARENNDFKAFLPALQEVIDLQIQAAEYLGYSDHPYDALLGQYERGMTTAQVKSIFEGHRSQLVDLIAAISKNRDRVSDAVLHQPFDLEKQKEFALYTVKEFGFDFERGRQDVAVHPFCTSFSRDDVRITTRFYPDFLNPALFGMMHEAGHGLYEQGSGAALEGTMLSGGTSLAVHESQSRMWENIVGRSKGFWSWALPQLKTVFPQLEGADLDSFYAAINKVEPSFIRVEADEVTYNLHIMLRFEMEVDMIGGKIDLARLPQEWNERFESYLGIVPPNDALGVLQDVHWSLGLVGYFATYALGNLLSVQYYNQALKDHPSIPDEIASGKFDTLLTWLNQNIHQYGRKFTSAELTQRVTGEAIQSNDYIQYLQQKFGAIYGL